MVRTLFAAIVASCIFGVLLGWSIAFGFLTVKAWQPESETKAYAALAQQARTQVTNQNAKASIEETTYNFGVMDVKASGAHDFYVKNVGTEDLILTVDRTTCSCTGIDISPTRVAPGKTARCHLKYNADRAITGKFSQGGIIRTNDPDNLEIHLIVEGIFTNPIVVQPATVSLPRVAAGTSRTATIRFYGFENEPLQLSDPHWQDREHFDFQWQPAELSDTDKEDSFLSLAKSVIEGTLTVKSGLPVGSFQEWFQMKTNYPSQANATFSVSGQIVSGNVSISGRGFNPATGIVDLGATMTGIKITREISIQFSGASAPSASVQIKSVEPAWVRTELSPPQDRGPLRIFSLTIEIPEEAPTGNYVIRDGGQQAHVTLETNNESAPVMKIPLQFAVGRQ